MWNGTVGEQSIDDRYSDQIRMEEWEAQKYILKLHKTYTQ
jgi:hypothetical protein